MGQSDRKNVGGRRPRGKLGLRLSQVTLANNAPAHKKRKLWSKLVLLAVISFFGGISKHTVRRRLPIMSEPPSAGGRIGPMLVTRIGINSVPPGLRVE